MNIFIGVYYRPLIDNNGFYDYGLADMGNNIIFIPATYFLLQIFNFKSKYGDIYSIYFSFLLLAVLEIVSKYIKYIGTYDLKDILGLFFGALLTHLLVFITPKKKLN